MIKLQVALASMAAFGSTQQVWTYEEADSRYSGTVSYNRGTTEIEFTYTATAGATFTTSDSSDSVDMESWRKITVQNVANYYAGWNYGNVFHLNDGLGVKYFNFNTDGIFHYDEAIYDTSSSTSNRNTSLNWISWQSINYGNPGNNWAMNEQAGGDIDTSLCLEDGCWLFETKNDLTLDM